jgi:phenylacetate-CoA ligase
MVTDFGQKYFNMDIEPFLNTPRMREIQESKIQKAVKFLYETCPYDRRQMDAVGIKPNHVRSLNDLSAIPIVGQSDFRKIFEEVDQDMLRACDIFFGEERMKQVHLFASTSGTTGVPTPYPFTTKGRETVAEGFGRMAWRANIRPGDRVAICFGLSMHGAGTPQLYWFYNMPNVRLIPIGAEVGTERMLQYMNYYKANVITCTPSLAQYLIEKAPEHLGKAIKEMNIKTLFCGGEPGAGIPEVRRHLENAYGAELFDIGAGYGVSCNHTEYQGMHWVADDFCHYQLVDPDTLELIPLENGAKGMAVFTTLEPEGAAFFYNLRVTLRDIHQVFTDPCPCGMSGFRYKIVGRADDMLKVKGVPVYPAAIQDVINMFVPQVTGFFRIVLDVPPPRVVPPLRLKVEYGLGVCESELPSITCRIQERMSAQHKITPEIIWLKPNTLERSTKKTQWFEKAYENAE